MQTLTVTRIVLSPTPSGNTPCSVWYSLGSDPTNWILINNNVSVPPSGVLSSALIVSTIPDGESSVNVRAVANCGGSPFDENFTTTTTTTTAATTTTTTAATTTTTTTAGTTTTTTAATTTTTTTSAPETFDLQITKEVDNDAVSVAITLGSGGAPISGSPFVSPAGENPTVFTGVFDVTQSFYFATVNLVTSGRPGAPIAVFDNTGSLGSISNGTTLAASGHDGADGDMIVEIGT